MIENKTGQKSPEQVEILPDKVTRRLLVSDEHGGISITELNPQISEDLRIFGRDSDDYVSIVMRHQELVQKAQIIVGIMEETRKARKIDGDTYVQQKPTVRNVWVGDEYVKLLTPDEAATIPYSGRTALDWATINGKKPEMVVRSQDRFFHPATNNDIVVTIPGK